MADMCLLVVEVVAVVKVGGGATTKAVVAHGIVDADRTKAIIIREFLRWRWRVVVRLLVFVAVLFIIAVVVVVVVDVDVVVDEKEEEEFMFKR